MAKIKPYAVLNIFVDAEDPRLAVKYYVNTVGDVPAIMFDLEKEEEVEIVGIDANTGLGILQGDEYTIGENSEFELYLKKPRINTILNKIKPQDNNKKK